jgi:lipopolysaccharide/colanic/teichoic acid biosynthesis glycosyltransferase
MVVGADRLLEQYVDLNATNGLLFKLADDPRVTKVGKVLRRLAIDELPQLFNVLAGHMSIVGPRPLAVDPTDFDEVGHERHVVRPGLTGAWQVHGGNALSYEDMVQIDVAYIANWSLWLDLRILARTPGALLVRRGAF